MSCDKAEQRACILDPLGHVKRGSLQEDVAQKGTAFPGSWGGGGGGRG